MSAAESTLTDKNYNGEKPFVDSVSTYGEIGADILPAERKKLLAAIDYLSKLEDGWNGHNAICPTELSINRSKGFVQKLWGKIYPDTVSPDGEGGVNFKWKNSQMTLILTVDSDFLHLSLAYAAGENKENIFLDNVPFDGEIIPSSVTENIPARPKSA